MVDINKLKEEQLKLSKKVIISDAFEKASTIAGVDCAFYQDKIVAAIIVCDSKTFEIKEKKFSMLESKIPYINGFLAYREGPAITEAYTKLDTKPDILIFDGNGILHPRRCGLASHIGVLLDKPSIGVAKQLMIGEVNGDIVYVDKEARAELIVTRDHSKPIYVSPGHKIGLKTSVRIVNKCIKFPHKLPEPLHLAHKYSNKQRDILVNGELKAEIKK